MSAQKVAEYRRNADECRKQGEVSVRSEDKARWLRLATDWQTLAEGLEMLDRQNVMRLVSTRH